MLVGIFLCIDVLLTKAMHFLHAFAGRLSNFAIIIPHDSEIILRGNFFTAATDSWNIFCVPTFITGSTQSAISLMFLF